MCKTSRSKSEQISTIPLSILWVLGLVAIGSVQLAHLKVEVGVTQVNRGMDAKIYSHGWLARPEHPLPRPN